MATKRDYYEVLEISRTATEGEISTSYRKLAIKYHPDSNQGDEEAIGRFKELAEAYEVLRDPQLRERYDRYGHAGVQQSGGGGPHEFTDLNDIFEHFSDIFGGGIFGDIFGGGRSRGRRVHRGADIQCGVTLTLEEAAKGVEKTLEFERRKICDHCFGSGAASGSQPETCPRCNGQGQVIQSAGILRVQTTCPSCGGQGKVITTPCEHCRGKGHTPERVKLEVSIPPGLDNGMQVRLSGEGQPSPNGGPPGDAFCAVKVRKHALFHRDGPHLILEFPITYTQAALGATLEVPTLEGKDTLDIPGGTTSGAVFRLTGRGMPDPHGRGSGDLLVQTHIEVPKRLTAEQEELLRQLAELEQVQTTPHRKTFLEKIKSFLAIGEGNEK